MVRGPKVRPGDPGRQARRLLATTLSRSSRSPLGFGFRLVDRGVQLVLEAAPKPIAGPVQPQVLLWATTPTLPATKLPRVPRQPLQVQHPLSPRPRPRLVHPQHAVPALHGAAAAHRPAQHRRHRAVRFPPVGVELRTEHRLHPRGHRAIAPDRSRVRAAAPLPTQPPQVHQGGEPLRRHRQLAQGAVPPIPERERLWCLEQPTDLGPVGAREPRLGRGDRLLCQRPIVELTIGAKPAQGRLGTLPSRLPGQTAEAPSPPSSRPHEPVGPGPACQGPAVLPVRRPGWPPRPAPRSVPPGSKGPSRPAGPPAWCGRRPGPSPVRLRRSGGGALGAGRYRPGAPCPRPRSPSQAPSRAARRPTRSSPCDRQPWSPGTRPCSGVRPRPGPARGGRRSRRGNRPGPRSWPPGPAA